MRVLQVKITEALNGANCGQVDIQNTTLNPMSTSRKKELDEMFTKWVVKSTRPINIGNDIWLRQWVSSLSGGRYKPPVPATVQKYTVQLAAQCKQLLRRDVTRLIAEKVMPSVAADIWGENGKSLFGVLLYYIDDNFVMHEKVSFFMISCAGHVPLLTYALYPTQVVCAEPFSEVQHSGDNIARHVKEQLADIGVGAYNPKHDIDTVGEEVHGVCTDQGGNMVLGFKDFEGGSCACHRLSNSLKTAFQVHSIAGVIKKVSNKTVLFLQFLYNHLLIAIVCALTCERYCSTFSSKHQGDDGFL